MTKFSRKYGQYILAVLGVILMLVFTVIPSLRGNQDQQNLSRQFGTLNGRKVTVGDIQNAGANYQALETFLKSVGGQPLPIDSENAGIQWYLLMQEAKHYGISTTDEEVKSIISSISNQLKWTDADWDTLFARTGLNLHSVSVALADWITLRKLEGVTRNSIPLSIPELELITQRSRWNISLDVVNLDARKSPANTTSTPAEIEAQFNKYKDIVRPAKGVTPELVDGHRYPFGYKFPDRVEVEYIVLPFEKLRAIIKPTAEDYAAATAEYNAHPERYIEFEPPATASQPATAPTTQQQADENYQRAVNKLVSDSLDKRAKTALKRLADKALTQLSDAWRSVPDDDEGFKQKIDSTKWPDYMNVVKNLASSREFPGFQPEYHHDPHLLTHDQLTELPGIGSAAFSTTTHSYPFADIALHVHELDKEKDDFRRLMLQVGVEGPILEDAAGNLYVFRVKTAEPSRLATLDEVKDQVAADLKALAAFQADLKLGQSLVDQADSVKGKLAELAVVQKLNHASLENLTRVSAERQIKTHDATVQPALLSPDFLTKAFGLVESSAQTQPAAIIASQPATTRAVGKFSSTLLVDEGNLSVFPIQLSNSTAPGPFEFQEMVQSAGYFQQYRDAGFTEKWLGLDSLMRRLNFVPESPLKGH